MHRIHANATALAASLALTVCEPTSDETETESAPVPAASAASELATAMCQAVASCDCEPVSEDDCVTAATAKIQSWLDFGQENGLAYQGECARVWLDYIAAVGCQGELFGAASDVELWELEQRANLCKMVVGTAQNAGDERCVAAVDGFADSCGPRERCYTSYTADGYCAPLNTRALGEVCIDYDLFYWCAPGLVCSSLGPDDPYICTRAPAAGDPCLGHDESCGGWDENTGLYCDGATATCEPLPTLGDACDGTECASGLACSYGSCIPEGAEGERCEGSFLSHTCSPRMSCDDGTCAARFPAICDSALYEALARFSRHDAVTR